MSISPEMTAYDLALDVSTLVVGCLGVMLIIALFGLFFRRPIEWIADRLIKN